ncbi:MAG: hypothetical protein Q9163_002831 [Psora crenata]
MSAIEIHTTDPLRVGPTKLEDKTPTTFPARVSTSSSQVAAAPAAAAASSYGYCSAQHGTAAPRPTRTVASTSADHPVPHPGVVPTSSSPASTSKAPLPPPPKVGEAFQPSTKFGPRPTAHPQDWPPQMSYAPPDPMTSGVPPSSTTSTSTHPSFSPSAPPTKLPTLANGPFQAPNLDHPPGYVQNPYASEMTAEQRLALHHEEHRHQSGSLGYTDNRPRAGSASARFDEIGEAWEGAKKWVMQKGGEVGEKVGELHERVWESVAGDK